MRRSSQPPATADSRGRRRMSSPAQVPTPARPGQSRHTHRHHFDPGAPPTLLMVAQASVCNTFPHKPGQTCRVRKQFNKSRRQVPAPLGGVVLQVSIALPSSRQVRAALAAVEGGGRARTERHGRM
ncbi:hypothetical protein BCR34DRAFT_578217 [Clohesyomyces aquaticus]|uniref:Uncharacterized protein n=1 Tax=Clohesyomyces aquaticus TaxID=1231657 RepID=A0A1Y1YH09_9PLEO|nr:hypothetical protein BCR34DRAFT_578217 [Clohesyomyces aquaticus]